MYRKADTALIIPPMNDSTVDIFCTARLYLTELVDLSIRMYAYYPL